MTKKPYALLAMSVLAVALAVPLMAQSIRLTGNISFEFTVKGKTLAAGEYMISSGDALDFHSMTYSITS